MVLDAEKLLFDFEKLTAVLEDEDRRRVEDIFFRKKYRLDLNNNLEEVFLDDWQGDFEKCLTGLKKEKRRKDLLRLTGDLKIAEKKKDKEAVSFLRQEFDKISKELSELEK